MDNKRRGPIGIELVRRGLVDQDDINKAIDYQRENPNKKINSFRFTQFGYTEIEVRQDLAGLDRVALGRKGA